jgi:hypothetical protein
MTSIAVLSSGSVDRARVEHADLCMEEAGIITFALAGLGLCAQVIFRDIGLSHLLPMDVARFAAWSLLAAGMFRHRALPACLLMLDLAARAGQLSLSDPLLLPSLLAIGGMTARGLLARLDALPSD